MSDPYREQKALIWNRLNASWKKALDTLGTNRTITESATYDVLFYLANHGLLDIEDWLNKLHPGAHLPDEMEKFLKAVEVESNRFKASPATYAKVSLDVSPPRSLR